MNDRSFNEEFHLREFEHLRNEIEMHISDRRKIETQYVIAIFAIYAWLFSRPADAGIDPALLALATGFPLLIAVYGFLKWSSIMTRTIEIGQYIMRLEASLTKTPEFGWEHSLKLGRARKPLMAQLEGQSGRVFWIALIIFTSVVFVWFLMNVRDSASVQAPPL